MFILLWLFHTSQFVIMSERSENIG